MVFRAIRSENNTISDPIFLRKKEARDASGDVESECSAEICISVKKNV